MVEKGKAIVVGAGSVRGESLLEAFAKDPAVREILEAKTRPRPERRSQEEYGKLQTEAQEKLKQHWASYKLDESLLPAGEEASQVAPLIPAPTPTFSETWDRYKQALYAVASTTSLASELLRQEQFRTRPGSEVWKTLGSLAEKAVALSTLVRREIAAVPEGNGLVE